MNRIITTLLSFFFLLNLSAQENYTSVNIPKELLINADAVIRTYEAEFIYKNKTSGIYKEKKIITILNKEGAVYASFGDFENMFRALNKFTGTFYDKNGKKISRITKKDLLRTEYFDGLASDAASFFSNSPIGIYPYTVCYEKEVVFKGGLLGFPSFFPLPGDNISMESGYYKIQIPETTEINYKSGKMEGPIKSVDKGLITLLWKTDSVKAFKAEPFSPDFSTLRPWLHVTNTEITYAGTYGRLDNWKTFGSWLYDLQKGRDMLPEKLKQKITDLTKECKTDKDKIKALYNYMGDNTRYVSIQIGIGGLQPMEASKVFSTGFGDCKALSNYMMAMLQETGIPAYNTIINSKSESLFEDFASAGQTDHEILTVPLKNDTLWIECTNPKVPLGYIPRHMAGHNVIVITPEGGIFTKIPDYDDKENLSAISANLQIDEKGTISGYINEYNSLKQYEPYMYFQALDGKKQIEAIRSCIDLPNPSISNIHFSEYKEEKPYAILFYNISHTPPLNQNNQRIFIPLNIFRNGITQLPKKERINPIVIKYGYHDTDTIHITIPQGYMVESLPKELNIRSRFGTFKTRYKNEKNIITAIYDFIRSSGKFEPSEYEELINFHQEINRAYKAKAVIKRL